jgi:hypothetical protein
MEQDEIQTFIFVFNKRPPLVPVVSQMSPVNISRACFCTTHRIISSHSSITRQRSVQLKSSTIVLFLLVSWLRKFLYEYA